MTDPIRINYYPDLVDNPIVSIPNDGTRFPLIYGYNWFSGRPFFFGQAVFHNNKLWVAKTQTTEEPSELATDWVQVTVVGGGGTGAGEHSHDSSYISIIPTPTEGNFPTITSGGELSNSTYNASSFAGASHNHDGTYATAAHNHDGTYSPVAHNHDADYISVVSTPTDGYFPTLTTTGELANSTYNPSSFAAAGHNHDGTYATASHNHDSDYISVVSTPTNGNFPTLTATGELNNSSYNSSSFATAAHNHDATYAALSHTHTSSNISDFTEAAQDAAASALTSGTHSGISVNYDDASNTINLTATGGGTGDMAKATYDTDNDGIVDNSEALGGQAGSHYLSRTNHTGTQTASTISDFNTAADARVTYTALNTNSSVGTGSTQVAQGNHTHSIYVDTSTTQTIAGAKTFSGSIVYGGASKIDAYVEKITAITASAGAATIQVANGKLFTMTLDQNVTFTISDSNSTSGYVSSFTLVITNDATASRTITWPASVKWAGGTAPTRTTTASAIDIWHFFSVNQGTTWYGNLALKDVK